jgi:hypothetical protein
MADIPRKDANFDTWFCFMYQYVSPKCAGSPPAWNRIPQAALMNLAELHTAWKTAYVTGIKVDTEAKNDAKKAAIAAVRPFVNQFLRYPPVTDEGRNGYGK